MHHDQRSDKPRSHTPTRRPSEFLFALAILKLDAAGAREVLAEKMRRSRLDRFPILHHGFNCKSLHRTREFFAFRFFARENRKCQMIANEPFINTQYQSGFRARFGFGFVNGVAFLPEKLCGPQKQARPHFPANDVCPLIYENWQVAVGLHPPCVAGADDRFRSGPDHKRFC